jgi:adenosine deaminase
VVESIRTHPIAPLYRRGVRVTVSTDDPKMFGTTLAEEFLLLRRELGFTRDDVRSLILQGIDSSWLDEERKSGLRQGFTQAPRWKPADLPRLS